MAKAKKGVGNNVKAILFLALGLFVVLFTIKITNPRYRSFENSSAAGLSGKAPQSVTQVFWPNSYAYQNHTIDGWTNLGPLKDDNTIVVQQPGASWSGYYASQFTSTPFDWENDGNNIDDTVGLIYGYTDAACFTSQNATFKLHLILNGNISPTQTLEFTGFNTFQCGPNGNGMNWFRAKSPAPSGTYDDLVTDMAFVFQQYSLNDQRFEVTNISLCNPNSDGSGCDIQTTCGQTCSDQKALYCLPGSVCDYSKTGNRTVGTCVIPECNGVNCTCTPL